ncbi:MAG: penicillin-binding protein 1A [Desulfomonilaceae bacterium]
MLLRKRRALRGGSLIRFLSWITAGFPILLLIAVLWGVFGVGLGTYLVFSADLPKIPDLRGYRPKTVSTFYAEDGTVIGLFYKEKRFPVKLDSLPPHVTNAFLAAEDARFFSHPGVDLSGVLRALLKNIKSGNFAQGGSTITQQVTRNIILSKEKKLSRKIREAILAFRVEKTFSKKEILELYLNEIYLGKGAYGVEAAGRIYFGKSASELTVAEAAMLAGFVANPSKYSSARNIEICVKRREFVLNSMLRTGFISEDQCKKSAKEEPNFRDNLPTPYQRVPYFTEAVRQYVVAKYGANKLYNEGLRVWTTCDISLQDKAQDALLKGAFGWEKRQGRPGGLVRRLKPAEAREFLKSPTKASYNAGDLVQALIVANNTNENLRGKQKEKKDKSKQENTFQELTMALAGDLRFRMELKSAIPYRPNDLLEFRVADTSGDTIRLEHQSLPPVEGAVVSIDNNNGYIRALVGGLDFERSSFNRAVQAIRQPGSAFKPLVYAAALEWADYSPHTLIVDEPIAVMVDPAKPPWIPKNADGQFLGPITLKQALAQSRNIAAVKLIMDISPERTIHMARKMGIRSSLDRNLSLSLGSSEVTPLELTSAYTVFPNMGLRISPVLIKRVEDRFGNVLEDNSMEPLNIAAHLKDELPSYPGKLMINVTEDHDINDEISDPAEANSGFIDELRNLAVAESSSGSSTEIEYFLSTTFPTRWIARRSSMERALSPATAYVMLSMLRETCVSGTAASVSRAKRKDLAGKTGTTDDCTDAWFVGFNSKYTTGVWLGHDIKTSLGPREYGGTAALPVWLNFMTEALAHEAPKEYPAPPGILFAEGGPGSTNIRQGSLLEANPDFGNRADMKRMCPVDAEFVTASYAPFSFSERFNGMNYGYDPSYNGIRVLSPKGESLNQPYTMINGWENSNSNRHGLPHQTRDADDPNNEGLAPDSLTSRYRWDQDVLSWFSNYLSGQGSSQ